MLRKARLHLVLNFGFAAKENDTGTHKAKTIRRTTDQRPSEQVISGRQTRMKGQRNSKAALKLLIVLNNTQFFNLRYFHDMLQILKTLTLHYSYSPANRSLELFFILYPNPQH